MSRSGTVAARRTRRTLRLLSQQMGGRCASCLRVPDVEPMERIFFEETSGPVLDAATALALKQKHVARLEAKIAYLKRKQEDLNRKVDEYIQGLRALIRSLVQSMEPPEGGAST